MSIVSPTVVNIANTQSVPHQENAREEALKMAYRVVVQRHPHAKKICFDWHFIDSWAEYLFEPFIAGGPIPKPQAIAGAWAEQFAYSYGWQQDAFKQALPIATDLTYNLETEVECTMPTMGIRLGYAM